MQAAPKGALECRFSPILVVHLVPQYSGHAERVVNLYSFFTLFGDSLYERARFLLL